MVTYTLRTALDRFDTLEMLSYRHGFHAGNFADVLKHGVLTLLGESLLGKEKGFFYLDTHAGAGLYDLASPFARKNREYQSGVARIWAANDVPEELRTYRDIVRALNPDGALRYSPGSPWTIHCLLRPQDRMVLCELHPTEVEALRSRFAGQRRVTVRHDDGYQAMKALLPPAERRGLVLCDPAFELRDERERLLEAAQLAYRRWPTGIFAYWHPIHERRAMDWLYRRFRQSGIERLLAVELTMFPETAERRMIGTGLVLVNPPWRLADRLARLLPWLCDTLRQGLEATWCLEWLAGADD